MLSLCVPFIEGNPIDQGHYQHQWNYIFNNWDIDKVYFIGEQLNSSMDVWSQNFSLNNKEIVYISNYNEILDETPVICTPRTSRSTPGEINLNNYTHPLNVCYIFGSNNNPLNVNIDVDKVYIESNNELFSWVSAGIFLYDRKIKSAN